MPPERCELVLFYRKVVKSPAFIWQRSLVSANLKSFDRKAFLGALEKECSNEYNEMAPIPTDYRMWIMEWPTQAALGCLWPGLRLHGLSGAGDPCTQWNYFLEEPIDEVSYPVFHHRGTVNSRRSPCVGIHKSGTEYVVLYFEEKLSRVAILPDGETIRDPASGLVTEIQERSNNFKGITNFSAWREMVFERLEEEYAAKLLEQSDSLALEEGGLVQEVKQRIPMILETTTLPFQAEPDVAQDEIEQEQKATKIDNNKPHFKPRRLANLLKVCSVSYE